MLLLILLLYTFVCMGASYDGRVTWGLKNRFPAPAATFNNTWSQETLVNTMHTYMRLALKIRVGAREWEKNHMRLQCLAEKNHLLWRVCGVKEFTKIKWHYSSLPISIPKHYQHELHKYAQVIEVRKTSFAPIPVQLLNHTKLMGNGNHILTN